MPTSARVPSRSQKSEQGSAGDCRHFWMGFPECLLGAVVAKIVLECPSLLAGLTFVSALYWNRRGQRPDLLWFLGRGLDGENLYSNMFFSRPSGMPHATLRIFLKGIMGRCIYAMLLRPSHSSLCWPILSRFHRHSNHGYVQHQRPRLSFGLLRRSAGIGCPLLRACWVDG